jgi:hypothetical protein
LRSPTELQGRSVLAGRFLFFKDDHPIRPRGDRTTLYVFFNKQGDTRACRFEPDGDGYVYVPVTEGQYNISRINYVGTMGAVAFLDLDPMPAVNVSAGETANFGTFEVRASESTLSKASTVAVGLGYIKCMVTHNGDCTSTCSELEARLKGVDLPITDRPPCWLKRMK